MNHNTAKAATLASIKVIVDSKWTHYGEDATKFEALCNEMDFDGTSKLCRELGDYHDTRIWLWCSDPNCPQSEHNRIKDDLNEIYKGLSPRAKAIVDGGQVASFRMYFLMYLGRSE